MSRGHGRVQQLILNALGYYYPDSVPVVWVAGQVVGRRGALNLTAAERSSINRALRNLQREGLIYASPLGGSKKKWALVKQPKGWKRRARKGSWRRYWQDFQAAADSQGPGRKAPPRARLAKMLGMLGSAHAGERASAAQRAEEERKRLGLTWEDIILMGK
jgi:hypothetical protein